jgi:ABC-type sugar transport system substrate-binding protein/DNA-binding response OmpR family regulator
MRHLVISFFLTTLLCACNSLHTRYVIGVSQCSEDIWRNKQNAELQMGSYFYEGIELKFATAYDSDERQIQQIDSLLSTGIDLLIVAPNQVATISPAIDRAFESGIPVIVFERKTNSKKYTAFMGADNYEMGRQMGAYIATRLQGHGNVMEVMGLKGSSPAIDRHKGFIEALSHYPDINIIATLQGDWTEQTSYSIVKEWYSHHKTVPVDLVFGMNDRSAIGARKALLDEGVTKESLPLFCGIDGLPGKDGGIQLVRDSILEASYIYPTHGDRSIQLAVDILDGKPFEKETLLMSALVTHDNANVLLMQSEEVMRQTAYLEQLHEQADSYLQKLDAQRMTTWLSVGMIVLLLLLLISIYYYFLQKTRLSQERTRMEHEKLDFYTQVSHELRTPLTLIEGPLAQLADTKDIREASPEASGMFNIVRRNTQQLTILINKMLDVSTSSNTQSIPEPSADTSLPLQQLTVSESDYTKGLLLIVDDNDDIRTYLRTILEKRYQLIEAANGQAGLEMACKEVPDLIISDVMMPVMNGLEFCQRVKSDVATSHVPVILLTARALSQHQVEGYESGADAYITKPFQPEVLMARVDNLLRQRQKLRELWSGTTHQEAPTKPESIEGSSTLNVREEAFIQRFRDVVAKQMSNSDLSVEDIGSELNLSRVHLYRKIKALTGQSPVELTRHIRLKRGRDLLETTDMTISEIAYKVGFTAPSYFTKCFKDEFGILPGELRN